MPGVLVLHDSNSLDGPAALEVLVELPLGALVLDVLDVHGTNVCVLGLENHFLLFLTLLLRILGDRAFLADLLLLALVSIFLTVLNLLNLLRRFCISLISFAGFIRGYLWLFLFGLLCGSNLLLRGRIAVVMDGIGEILFVHLKRQIKRFLMRC